MAYMLVRHRVNSFAQWKPVFDAHAGLRRAAGLEDLHVLRGADDPQVVIVLCKANDLTKARKFAQSEDLKTTMSKAGVIGRPDISFLE